MHKVFKDFLKQEGVYKLYKQNLKKEGKTYKSLYTEVGPVSLIYSAFIWETPNWEDLDNKWEAVLATLRITAVREYNCGKSKRTVYIYREFPEIIHIGCFSGTRKKAIKAIKDKYTNKHQAEDYINSIENCFNKL